MKAVTTCLIIFLALNVVELRWRPVTRPKKHYAVKILPNQMDKAQLAQLKLPNNIFCAQMEKQTAGIYILMPWWYNYCQDLKDERARKLKHNNVFYKPIYKNILDHMQWHRRHKRTMDQESNIQWVIIALQMTNILAKKKYKERSSSEESIENILYYQDCNHKHKNAEPKPLRAIETPPPKPQDCKMSCTMCCGGECVNNDQTLPSSFINDRTMVEPMSNQMQRQPDGPIQPILRPRKKKIKPSLLPPIGGRRDFGFTRENIKNLISQDEDIKKILKDLVKVTMQKVDLVEMINARRNQMNGSEEPLNKSENEEEA